MYQQLLCLLLQPFYEQSSCTKSPGSLCFDEVIFSNLCYPFFRYFGVIEGQE